MFNSNDNGLEEGTLSRIADVLINNYQQSLRLQAAQARAALGLGAAADDDDDEDHEYDDDDDDDDDDEDEDEDEDEDDEDEDDSDWEDVSESSKHSDRRSDTVALNADNNNGSSPPPCRKTHYAVHGLSQAHQALQSPCGDDGGRLSLLQILRSRETGGSPSSASRSISFRLVPNSSARTFHRFPHKVYCGQFSRDGTLFYAATQSFQIHLFDGSTMEKRDVIQAVPGRWTMTDCDLAANNAGMVYSSIEDTAYYVGLDPSQHSYGTHRPLRFDGEFGIFSVRISESGKEVVAGTNSGMIMVYNMESSAVLHKIPGHVDDINAVCFADASSNILVSGSDDSFLKVWDRRSLHGGSRPTGVFIGHTEGVTFVSSRDDGRHLLSNGKDQRMLMWDMRMMLDHSQCAEAMRLDLSTGFDYRWESFPMRNRLAHKKPNYVKCFEGHHRVLRTLVRCFFSPAATTGQRYVYSGSADGRVAIYDVNAGEGAAPVRVLRAVKHTRSREDPYEENMILRFLTRGGIHGVSQPMARDVSWHPELPVIIASGWADSEGLVTGYRFERNRIQ